MDENKNSHQKLTMTHTQTTYIIRIALRAGKKKGVRSAKDPHIWPGKSRTTSSNIHSAAM